MRENAQIIPQGKVYQKYLENTENKAELIDRFTQYIQQDHVRTKLTGNIIFNSRNLTYRINSCELETLFTSNHFLMFSGGREIGASWKHCLHLTIF